MTRVSQHPETIVLHAGYRSDPATQAVAVPIYQTTSYAFHDTQHAADLFALRELGNIYTRITNPTCAVLEQRMAALEGGAAGLALSSGQAATTLSILNICESGDNFIASTDLYGGTWNLFANTFLQMGIEARFVDPADPEAFGRTVDDRTRCFYAETLPNPKLQTFPIQEVSDIGHALGIPLIMDNTTAPILCRPIAHGAAVVVYSTTKYIGGHGTSIGGIIIDSGGFAWNSYPKRFPLLNQPDPNYHGTVWTEVVKPLGPIAYSLRMRATLLRDIGTTMSPFNAFAFLQGLETLPLRMRAHCANAERVALYLNAHPLISRVIYPSLQKGESLRRAHTYLQGGYGALVGFELKNGREAGRRFIDALQMFYHVANIGDARSLAIHPATTTHSQLTPEDQLSSGVSTSYVRLSVGIEHIDDILKDIEQALAQSETT